MFSSRGLKQAGTGPSRRHIQGSKIAKGLPRVNLQYSKIEKAKNGPSGAPGPASASPWRAKRGTLPKLSTFLSQLKGGPFGDKKQTSEKVSQCRQKLEITLCLARYGMLRGKTGKNFLVQFTRPNGAIIFCRTFENYFGQFVWIEKRVTSIVAFHYMKRRLETSKNQRFLI